MLHIRTIIGITFCIACLLMTQTVSADQPITLGDSAQYTQLQTSTGQSFTAYVAGPQHATQAILMIHGWWGLNRDVETWANEFAVAGYRVMAVDLYKQQTTTHPAEAKKLMQAVKQSDANKIYATAINTLATSGRKVAIIGRSYGASQALHAALVAQDKASAVIVYYPYGELIADNKMLSAIKSPILGHFARNDFFLTPDKLARFSSNIKQSGLNMTGNIYEARHGFDSYTGKNFDEPAHKLAQQRTRQFLGKYLN
ncbi:MAG: alpha/beta fold hydrolase [Gammaproteobacteria bacterium]|nr:alpha/beta fold hydrolase [Gammaproteobacteria bacterium]